MAGGGGGGRREKLATGKSEFMSSNFDIGGDPAEANGDSWGTADLWSEADKNADFQVSRLAVRVADLVVRVGVSVVDACGKASSVGVD